MKRIQPAPPSSAQIITCLFCRAGVRMVKFQHHLNDGHQVFFDHDLISKLNVMGREALEKMVETGNDQRRTSAATLKNEPKETKQDKMDIQLENYPEVHIRKVKQESNSEVKIPKEENEVVSEIQIRKVKVENGADAKICNERNKVITLNENDLFDPGFGESCNMTISVTECNKQFSRKEALMRHKKIHTGQKDFSCEVCPKKFGRKDKLIIHIRTHTGEKPFSCHQCEKSFSKKDALNKHTKQHTERGEDNDSEEILDDTRNLPNGDVNSTADEEQFDVYNTSQTDLLDDTRNLPDGDVNSTADEEQFNVYNTSQTDLFDDDDNSSMDDSNSVGEYASFAEENKYGTSETDILLEDDSNAMDNNEDEEYKSIGEETTNALDVK